VATSASPPNDTVVFWLAMVDDNTMLERDVMQTVMQSPNVRRFSFTKSNAMADWADMGTGRWTVNDGSTPTEVLASRVSHLEALPTELRNYIYDLVLTQPDVALARKPHSPNLELWMTRPSHKSQYLALTMVSRQIRSEALPLFFATTTFRLESNSIRNGTPFENDRESGLLLSSLSRRLQSVAMQKARQLGSLTVDVSDWFSISFDKSCRQQDSRICQRVRAAVLDAPPMTVNRTTVEVGLSYALNIPEYQSTSLDNFRRQDLVCTKDGHEEFQAFLKEPEINHIHALLPNSYNERMRRKARRSGKCSRNCVVLRVCWLASLRSPMAYAQSFKLGKGSWGTISRQDGRNSFSSGSLQPSS